MTAGGFGSQPVKLGDPRILSIEVVVRLVEPLVLKDFFNIYSVLGSPSQHPQQQVLKVSRLFI